jgi:YD repeat-containing protein
LPCHLAPAARAFLTTTFGEFGLTVSTTDGRVRTTSYDYDLGGNRVQTRYPDKGNTPVTVSRTVYDEKNRPVLIQDRAAPEANDPLEQTRAPGTRLIYDALGRVVPREQLQQFALNFRMEGGFAVVELGRDERTSRWACWPPRPRLTTRPGGWPSPPMPTAT